MAGIVTVLVDISCTVSKEGTLPVFWMLQPVTVSAHFDLSTTTQRRIPVRTLKQRRRRRQRQRQRQRERERQKANRFD